jgi:hypothetical protein
MNRGQRCTDRIERIRRQETPLTELEAELKAEKGHSTLTNENKNLKACLSSKELNEIFYDQPGE